MPKHPDCPPQEISPICLKMFYRFLVNEGPAAEVARRTIGSMNEKLKQAPIALNQVETSSTTLRLFLLDAASLRKSPECSNPFRNPPEACNTVKFIEENCIAGRDITVFCDADFVNRIALHYQGRTSGARRTPHSLSLHGNYRHALEVAAALYSGTSDSSVVPKLDDPVIAFGRLSDQRGRDGRRHAMTGLTAEKLDGVVLHASRAFMYILAHEIGHIYFRHPDRSQYLPPCAHGLNVVQQSRRETLLSFKKEAAADRFAFEMIAGVQGSATQAHAYAVQLLWELYLEGIGASIASALSSDDYSSEFRRRMCSSTHPSFLTRIYEGGSDLFTTAGRLRVAIASKEASSLREFCGFSKLFGNEDQDKGKSQDGDGISIETTDK